MPALLSTSSELKEQSDAHPKTSAQAHPTLFTVHLRGDFTILNKQGVDVTPKSQKVKAIIVYLAMSDNGRAKRSDLASLFWPDHDEDKARVSLRQALLKLRRSLNSGVYPVITASRSHVYLQKKYLNIVYDNEISSGATCSSLKATPKPKDEFEYRALSGIFLQESTCQHWLEHARRKIKREDQEEIITQRPESGACEETKASAKQDSQSTRPGVFSILRQCFFRIVRQE